VSALDQLLRNARAERCQLRHFWDLGEHLPGREQPKLAQALARIVPATVEREGRRVRCESRFELRPKDRRRLVLAMLTDGASRSEILSSVPGLSERTLRHIASQSATQSSNGHPESPPTNGIPERRFRQKRDDPVGATDGRLRRLNRDYRRLADRLVESGFNREIRRQLDQVFAERSRAINRSERGAEV
jgi:hypothetical protein